MASRLSEETRSAIYNSGCNGLRFDSKLFNSNKFWAGFDLDELSLRPGLATLVPQLPTQSLYCALMERGPAAYPEILKNLSSEQVQRFLDYDAWQKDSLVPQQALSWLKLFRDLSTEQAYKRLRDLDEEYQIGMFSPFVRVYDKDAYESMPDEEQDRLYRLPNDALFYAVLSDEKDVHENIVGLIEAVLAHDINYAMSLLCHSAYLPPQESAHLLSQFRRARLEEDGFVSYEEGLTCFAEIDVDKKKARWTSERRQETLITLQASEEFFLDQVLNCNSVLLWQDEEREALRGGLVFLANALCAAVEIETDDLSSLKTVFTHTKALVSLGLDFLSDGDLPLAAKILQGDFPKELFRVGLTLLKAPQRRFITALGDLDVKEAEKARKAFIHQKPGLLLDWMDNHLRERMGFEESEVLKGIFNRFPMIPQFLQGKEGEDRITFVPVKNLQGLKTVESIVDRSIACLKNLSQS